MVKDVSSLVGCIDRLQCEVIGAGIQLGHPTRRVGNGLTGLGEAKAGHVHHLRRVFGTCLTDDCPKRCQRQFRRISWLAALGFKFDRLLPRCKSIKARLFARDCIRRRARPCSPGNRLGLGSVVSPYWGCGLDLGGRFLGAASKSCHLNLGTDSEHRLAIAQGRGLVAVTLDAVALAIEEFARSRHIDPEQAGEPFLHLSRVGAPDEFSGEKNVESWFHVVPPLCKPTLTKSERLVKFNDALL